MITVARKFAGIAKKIRGKFSVLFEFKTNNGTLILGKIVAYDPVSGALTLRDVFSDVNKFNKKDSMIANRADVIKYPSFFSMFTDEELLKLSNNWTKYPNKIKTHSVVIQPEKGRSIKIK